MSNYKPEVVQPYFPDQIQEVVERVDQHFINRVTDPFNVFFEKGIIGQVRKSVYTNPEKLPLVWLVMRFDEELGRHLSVTETVNFQLIIAMDTLPEYTQQQREDINFKPRLLPIYNQLLKEIANYRGFQTRGAAQIYHKRHLLPYWGHGDVDGTNVDNMFKGKYIDAISMAIPALQVRRVNC